MTVSELLQRISSAELSEWMALFELESEERRRAELGRKANEGVVIRKNRLRNR